MIRRRFLGTLCVLPWAMGCRAQVVQRQGFAFGTLIELTALGQDAIRVEQILADVLTEFDRLHRLLHAWEPSPLSALNQAIAQGSVQHDVPLELIRLLQGAADWSRRADYLFNPAIGGLIRLWGFWSDHFQAVIPAALERQQWLAAHPTLDDLTIQGQRVGSRNRAVQIDLGGYAKGYALDRAASILRQANIKQALINIGGNVLALGDKAGEPWQVGVRNPRGNQAMAVVSLRDGEAIGTSGDYQRFFMLDKKRYCHIIDPRTGEPVNDTAALTVLVPAGDDVGIRSDVLSKPLFISGSARWRQSAAGLGVTQAVRIGIDGRREALPALEKRLHWLST